jgi:hypothetical protein
MSTIKSSTTTTTAYQVSADTTGALVIQTGATPTTAMTIDTSQNVGIGTTSPAAILHTSISGSGEVGRFATTTDNTPFVSIYSNGSIRAKLRASTAETALLSQGALPLLLGTNDTERMRINASAPILCLAGGSTTATGTGIAFPATQSASSDANTLDDYEEGTWTPTVTFGGGSTGQTGTFAGFYTKTGNQVFATALINLTNKGSSTGTMAIGGLPFTSNSNSNYRATSTSVLWDNLATAYVYMLALIPGSSTSMEFLAATASSTTNAANPTQAAVNNTSVLRVSITYQV